MALNQIRLSGRVSRAPERRESPAGIPIARFVLEHSSEQTEAGMQRRTRFRIAVVAAGEAIAERAARLERDDWVQVTGFINRADFRSGDQRLVIHAEQIDYMGTEVPGT